MNNSYQQFKESYLSAVLENGGSRELAEKNMEKLYEFALEESASPTPFAPFHVGLEDFYQFGLDFFRPLIQFEKSHVYGKEHLHHIVDQIHRGENVILLANHQTEPDPQIISLLLEKECPQLAKELIFVAGHRVITDPFAIPFSKGRNLLCIYSKRYMEHPPEMREEKTLHNRRTLERLKELLQEGGKCVYVAPSGGRDRQDASGSIPIAPFDPASLELFRLMAKDTKTTFYPFAMDTYHLFPPPDSIHTELGEVRRAKAGPVSISFGAPLHMDHFMDHFSDLDKHERREARASYVWGLVNELYQKMKEKNV